MIPTGEFHTHSAEETFELAYQIGEAITESTIFLLHGDLGAGKTVFAKGIAAGLDIDPAEVNSPTFTLISQYDGRMRLYHLDLYRIEGRTDELRELGLEDILDEPNAVVVIEWPERIGEFKIPATYRVNIHNFNGNERLICLSKASRQGNRI